MSRPIARHADGSACYTVGCSLGQHLAVDHEREAFISDGMKPSRTATAGQGRLQPHEARRQAEFKQEWRERAPGWKELGFQYPVSVRRYDHWVKYSLAGL